MACRPAARTHARPARPPACLPALVPALHTPTASTCRITPGRLPAGQPSDAAGNFRRRQDLGATHRGCGAGARQQGRRRAAAAAWYGRATTALSSGTCRQAACEAPGVLVGSPALLSLPAPPLPQSPAWPPRSGLPWPPPPPHHHHHHHHHHPTHPPHTHTHTHTHTRARGLQLALQPDFLSCPHVPALPFFCAALSLKPLPSRALPSPSSPCLPSHHRTRASTSASTRSPSTATRAGLWASPPSCCTPPTAARAGSACRCQVRLPGRRGVLHVGGRPSAAPPREAPLAAAGSRGGQCCAATQPAPAAPRPCSQAAWRAGAGDGPRRPRLRGDDHRPGCDLRDLQRRHELDGGGAGDGGRHAQPRHLQRN